MGDGDEPAAASTGASGGGGDDAEPRRELAWGPPRPLGGDAPPAPGLGPEWRVPWHAPPDLEFRPPPPPRPHTYAHDPPPARRRRRGRVVVTVLAALVVLAGVAVGGRWLWDRVRSTVSTSEAVEEYLEGGGGVSFSAPEAGFTAEFPAEVERERSSQTNADGLAVDFRSYAVATTTAEFVVFVVDVPAGAGVDLEAAARFGSVNGGMDATLVSTTDTTFHGHPAIETLVLAKGEIYVRTVTVATPMRVYSIAVSSRTNPPPGFERFRDSVQLSP